MSKLNNKGYSYVSLIFVLAFLGFITVMSSNFKLYISKEENNSKIINEVSQEITNELSLVYNEKDWSKLNDKTVTLPKGEMKVEYSYKGETKHNTKMMMITFTKDGVSSSFNVERSGSYGL